MYGNFYKKLSILMPAAARAVDAARLALWHAAGAAAAGNLAGHAHAHYLAPLIAPDGLRPRRLAAPAADVLTGNRLLSVNNGVVRRAWGRNDNAQFAIARAMAAEPRLRVTVAHTVGDEGLLQDAAATAAARADGKR